jgi:hypothetical protein
MVILASNSHVTNDEDLADPAFEGHAGMFSEMRDTRGPGPRCQGVAPETATIDLTNGPVRYGFRYLDTIRNELTIADRHGLNRLTAKFREITTNSLNFG